MCDKQKPKIVRNADLDKLFGLGDAICGNCGGPMDWEGIQHVCYNGLPCDYHGPSFDPTDGGAEHRSIQWHLSYAEMKKLAVIGKTLAKQVALYDSGDAKEFINPQALSLCREYLRSSSGEETHGE